MAITKFMMVKLMLLMKRIMAKFTVGEALQSLLTRKEPTSGKVQERPSLLLLFHHCRFNVWDGWTLSRKHIRQTC